MGLRNTELCSSKVDFAGIQEYADSGTEDRPIRSSVELAGGDELLVEKSGLALLVAHGAARLLSLLRNSEKHFIPFMELVETVSSEILENKPGADFRIRDCVVTDPRTLAIYSDMGANPHGLALAEVNSGIPILSEDLDPPERTVLIKLMAAKKTMAPWVSYKFKLSSSNPLTTIAAWTSTVEYAVRSYPVDQVAVPMAAALYVLSQGWIASGRPDSVTRNDLGPASLIMTNVIIADDSVGMIDWTPG